MHAFPKLGRVFTSTGDNLMHINAYLHYLNARELPSTGDNTTHTHTLDCILMSRGPSFRPFGGSTPGTAMAYPFSGPASPPLDYTCHVSEELCYVGLGMTIPVSLVSLRTHQNEGMLISYKCTLECLILHYPCISVNSHFSSHSGSILWGLHFSALLVSTTFEAIVATSGHLPGPEGFIALVIKHKMGMCHANALHGSHVSTWHVMCTLRGQKPVEFLRRVRKAEAEQYCEKQKH